MSTFTQLRFHIVFGTKERRPAIRQPGELHGYLGGIVRNLAGTPLAIGGVVDHVHLLVGLPANLALADVVRDVKANSSRWLREQDGRWPGWQSGYGGFTVSQSQVEVVRAYVHGQEEHHRTTTFEEEFLALLKRHGIEYDERYVWD